MGAPLPGDGSVSGACKLDECGHCHGNIDLKAGPGPAVPLLRCAHRCHRRQPVQVREMGAGKASSPRRQ